MNTTLTASPSPRVAPNLKHAFGGVWRLTVGSSLTPKHGLTVLGMVALLALITIGTVHEPRVAERFFTWTCGFYLMFLAPMFAYISAGGAIRDDLKPGSVDYVFTRPVPRFAFVVFKFVAHLACVQCDFLVALAALIGVGLFREVPGVLAAVPLLLLGQLLSLLAFSAFGFFCGVLTPRYVVVGLIYGASIEVGLGQIPTPLNQLAMTHQVKLILEPLLNSNASLAGLPQAGHPALVAIAVLLICSAAAVALAALVFSSRELAGASSRDG